MKSKVTKPKVVKQNIAPDKNVPRTRSKRSLETEHQQEKEVQNQQKKIKLTNPKPIDGCFHRVLLKELEQEEADRAKGSKKQDRNNNAMI